MNLIIISSLFLNQNRPIKNLHSPILIPSNNTILKFIHTNYIFKIVPIHYSLIPPLNNTLIVLPHRIPYLLHILKLNQRLRIIKTQSLIFIIYSKLTWIFAPINKSYLSFIKYFYCPKIAYFSFLYRKNL